MATELPPGPTREGAASRRLSDEIHAETCYFRSGPPNGQRKVLLQITERCDLRCSHCFVSATGTGSDMDIEEIRRVIPKLKDAKVANVTLTGGEPLVHPDFVKIVSELVAYDFDVTVCSNGASLTVELAKTMRDLGRVRFNLSLDGFSEASHGRFRGDRSSFERTIQSAKDLAALEILKGLLCTPNELGTVDEYREVYAFGREMNVDYVLMNPLSKFGRGESNQRLRSVDATMSEIERVVRLEADVETGPESVFTRFPNSGKALGRCVAGEIFYVFVNGDATVCPYLVFASRTEGSKHDPSEFVFANLFADPSFATRLEEFDFHKRYNVAATSCATCSIDAACGKGCPAAVISSGDRIGEAVDALCPRPALPVALPIPRRRSQTAAIA